MRRNLISGVPRRWPQFFLECRAPSAADRSRGEVGRSLPPGPGRNAGPTPSCWGAAPVPHSTLHSDRANCEASKARCPVPLRSASTADRCSPAGLCLPLELIGKLTTSLAHSTPSRSSSELSKGVHQFAGGSVDRIPEDTIAYWEAALESAAADALIRTEVELWSFA